MLMGSSRLGLQVAINLVRTQQSRTINSPTEMTLRPVSGGLSAQRPAPGEPTALPLASERRMLLPREKPSPLDWLRLGTAMPMRPEKE